MKENQSIKDTLNVIRKALEDDGPLKIEDVNENILILNQLVGDDGTIEVLKETSLTRKDTTDALNLKLNEVFDKHLSIWLDKNIPNYLEKYFKNKDN